MLWREYRASVLNGEGMLFTVCEDGNVPCSGWKNLVYEIIFANKQVFWEDLLILLSNESN